MKWFKHDASANRDDKLGKVLLKYGSDGYALYWLCLELIADRLDKDHADFELRHDAELLGAILKIDTLRVEEIMKYFLTLKLFEANSGTITCLKLAKRIEQSIIRNPHIKAIASEIVVDNPRHSATNLARLDQIRLDKNTNTDRVEAKEPSFEAMSLANLLYDLHLPIDSGFKATDRQLQQWGADIDKLHRIDVRDFVQIDSVIRWAKSDPFWKSNIISGKKLREKYAILVAKMPKRDYTSSELKEVIAPDEFGEMLERGHHEK